MEDCMNERGRKSEKEKGKNIKGKERKVKYCRQKAKNTVREKERKRMNECMNERVKG